MNNREELLRIEDLSVCYHAYDDVVHAVNHVSLSLEEGRRWALWGKPARGRPPPP